MRPRTWPLACLVGALLAAVAAPATATAGGGLVVDRPVRLPGGESTTEPSITIDRKGAIYVSAPNGITGGAGSGHPSTSNSPAWRSTDGGRSFQPMAIATVASQPSRFGGGDTDIVVDPRGYIYATDLWLGDDSISISTDGGRTWTGSPVSHRPADDRNWLAYSDRDQALYQVYDGLDGIWISRADLGTDGDTSQALVMRNNFPVVTRPGYVSPPGRLAVDQRTGRLFVCFDHNDGQLDCATSADKGATWSVRPVPNTRGVGVGIMPDVVVDAAGTVYVAWRQKHDVLVAASTDHGATWRTRQIATEGQFTTLAVLGDGHVGVAWMQQEAAGFSVRYAEYPQFLSSDRSRRAVVDPHVFGGRTLARELGDFFRMAVAPNKDVFVTYSATLPVRSTNVVRVRAR
jgi:hypothetical protein